MARRKPDPFSIVAENPETFEAPSAEMVAAAADKAVADGLLAPEQVADVLETDEPEAEPAPDILDAVGSAIAATSAEALQIASLPAASSSEWKARIATVERKREEAAADLASAEEQSGLLELILTMEAPGAEEVAANHRQFVLGKRIAIEGLDAALRLAKLKLQEAEQVEANEAHAARVNAAKAMAQEYVTLCAKLDALLRKAGPIADALSNCARNLAAYSDVTKVSLGRMNLTANYTGAVHASAAQLARLLDLDRGGRPLPEMQPLAVSAARFWSLFTRVEIPTDPDTAIVAQAPDDPSLGQYGGRVLAELTAGGKTYQRGDVLAADVVLAWPLKNRQALRNAGRVEFLTEPKPWDL